MRKLKAQYEDFCQAYSECANAGEAAIWAGYSKNNCFNTGYRLLKRPEIVARIHELRVQLAERESLRATALLAKLETAYTDAAKKKDALAIVRIVELQAKIAGFVGVRRVPRSAANDDEIDGDLAAEIATLTQETPEPAPQSKPRPKSHKAKPQKREPQPPAEPVVQEDASLGQEDAPLDDVSVAEVPLVVMPVTGLDEATAEHVPETVPVATPIDPLPSHDDLRRLALEALARSRVRKRLRLSAG